jgi:hypothetical protein
MPQQVGDPLSVFHVGLAPRDRLQMLRVDQQQLEALLKYVEYWLPVAAGALHRDMGDSLLRQPATQLLQLVRHRPKCAHMPARQPAMARCDGASHDELFVDV